jgi:hypothetical protein
MESWVARVLEVYRMMPEEVEELERRETAEYRVWGFNRENGEWSDREKRAPYALGCWEIQRVFHKPSLKDYYNLQGKGLTADEQTRDRLMQISEVVKGVMIRDSGVRVMMIRCRKCEWNQTLADNEYFGGDDIAHEDTRCVGETFVIHVREVEKAFDSVLNRLNIPGHHLLHRMVKKHQDQLSMKLHLFLSARNAPKNRYEKVLAEKETP